MPTGAVPTMAPVAKESRAMAHQKEKVREGGVTGWASQRPTEGIRDPRSGDDSERYVVASMFTPRMVWNMGSIGVFRRRSRGGRMLVGMPRAVRVFRPLVVVRVHSRLHSHWFWSSSRAGRRLFAIGARLVMFCCHAAPTAFLLPECVFTSTTKRSELSCRSGSRTNVKCRYNATVDAVASVKTGTNPSHHPSSSTTCPLTTGRSFKGQRVTSRIFHSDPEPPLRETRNSKRNSSNIRG